jgi:hypothetical protein
MPPKTRANVDKAASTLANALKNTPAQKRKTKAKDLKIKEQAAMTSAAENAIEKSTPKKKQSLSDSLDQYKEYGNEIAFLLLQTDADISTNRNKKVYYSQLLGKFDHNEFPIEAERIGKRIKSYDTSLRELREGRLEVIARAKEDAESRRKSKKKQKVVVFDPKPFISGELRFS